MKGTTFFDPTLLAGLRDRDLAREGLVLAEGRLLAERLLLAAGLGRAAGTAGPGSAGGMAGSSRAAGTAGLSSETGPAEALPASPFPRPRFEALGLVCVPSLAEHFEGLAVGLCPLLVRSEAELSVLAGFHFHRGVLALARRLPLPRLEEQVFPEAGRVSRLLLLPATADPENMGSITRSAAALGYDALLLGRESCDHLSRRAVRVSMGAAFSLPAFTVEGPAVLGLLGGAGYAAAAAVLDPGAADLGLWTPPKRLVLLIGNEFEGLEEAWLGAGVERLTVPMAPGSDSLNAAAAAAIFLYEASRLASRGDGR